MSLIIAYALTIVGLIFAGVHDFAGMGIFLTVIGVVITLVHGLRAKYKPVALIAALAAFVIGSVVAGVLGTVTARRQRVTAGEA